MSEQQPQSEQQPRIFLPNSLPSHPDQINKEETVFVETPRLDRTVRVAKRVLGYGGVVLFLGAAGYGIYGAIWGEGPFGIDKDTDDRKNQAGPRYPGPRASSTASPSASVSGSAAPSRSPSASPSASTLRSPSAAESASASTRPTGEASVLPGAQTKTSSAGPEAVVQTPDDDTACATPSGGALTLCNRNVPASQFVGYRTLRDSEPIWKPLRQNAAVVPECQVPGYVLVDDESRPVGSQAAYVPVQALVGDIHMIPSCEN